MENCACVYACPDTRRVLDIFKEISAIPRGSGNEKAIADYVEAFGKRFGYFTSRDDWHNVIVRRPAAPGYEDVPALVLQGHMDMVCEANSGTVHDFLKDPIRVIEDGDIIHADGTTLGADNGIAVAIMMALLEKEDLQAPMLECIFTSDEETGMSGMENLDTSCIIGRQMINLDSAGEGEATVACAGGVRSVLTLPVKREKLTDGETVWKLSVSGLAGGHSGEDIHRNRKMATLTASKICGILRDKCGIRLISLDGGNKENAISRECTALFAASVSSEVLQKEVDAVVSVLHKSLVEEDKELFVSLSAADTDFAPMTEKDSDVVLALVHLIPAGVQAMSLHIPGLVETSANVGIITTYEDKLTVNVFVRSLNEEGVDEMESLLRYCASLSGADLALHNRYPGWAFRDSSVMQDLYKKKWMELFGTKPKIAGIHAGLECGLFMKKIPDMDIISIGPDIRNLHSPDEMMTISSLDKLLCLLFAMLADKNL
ncbi:MAG: beta-Ala-His dipeptidase [Clostridia bacterium]|nr:beta-Ala-His dipeptidase [Clostridia bacterium]